MNIDNMVTYEGTDLKDVDFRNADLQNANFKSANLINVDLRGADLRGADFTNAYLDDVYLDDAFLMGANFSGAVLENVGCSEFDMEFSDDQLKSMSQIPPWIQDKITEFESYHQSYEYYDN